MNSGCVEKKRPNGSVSSSSNRHRRPSVQESDTSQTSIWNTTDPKEIAEYYLEMGDFKTILPKTDNTYSPSSKYYNDEIVPGIPRLPNMSRDVATLRSSPFDLSWNTSRGSTSDSTVSHASDKRSSFITYHSFENKNGPLSSTKLQRHESQKSYRLDNSSDSISMSCGDSGILTSSSPLLRNGNMTYNLRSSNYNQFGSNNYRSSRYARQDVPNYANKLNESVKRALSNSIENVCLTWNVTNIFNRITRVMNKSVNAINPVASGNSCVRYLAPFLLFLVLLAFLKGDISDTLQSAIMNNSETIKHELEIPVRQVTHGLNNVLASLVGLTLSTVTFVPAAMWNLTLSSSENIKSQARQIWINDIRPSVLMFSSMGRGSSTSEKNRYSDDVPSGPVDYEKLAQAILETNSAKSFLEKWNENRRSQLAGDVISSKEFKDYLSKEWDARESQRKYEEKLSRQEERVIIEKQIISVLAVIFGKGADSDFEDLKKYATSLKEFQKELRMELREINDYIHTTMKEEMRTSLRDDIEQLVMRNLADSLKTRHLNEECDEFSQNFERGDFKGYVDKAIRDAIKLYDADKTGLVDYALESSGGTVVSVRCTETIRSFAHFSIFGLTLWKTPRSPRTVIQSGVQPGECWPFVGSVGYLVIELSQRIRVTGFTMEHIPRTLAPEGNINSAPKNFSVWGIESEKDHNPIFLGDYMFDKEGDSLQYFSANESNLSFPMVELKIETNHGNIEYTCLYRFRVHGKPVRYFRIHGFSHNIFLR